MKQKLENLIGNWYGKINDIIEEVHEIGAFVFEVNSEYLVAEYQDNDEDVQVLIRLGGTPTTITINSIEEIYRG